MNRRLWVIDTLSSILFWGILWFIIYSLVGLPFNDIVNLTFIGMVFNALLGGVFGRYLNFMRKNLDNNFQYRLNHYLQSRLLNGYTTRLNEHGDYYWIEEEQHLKRFNN